MAEKQLHKEGAPLPNRFTRGMKEPSLEKKAEIRGMLTPLQGPELFEMAKDSIDVLQCLVELHGEPNSQRSVAQNLLGHAVNHFSTIVNPALLSPRMFLFNWAICEGGDFITKHKAVEMFERAITYRINLAPSVPFLVESALFDPNLDKDSLELLAYMAKMGLNIHEPLASTLLRISCQDNMSGNAERNTPYFIRFAESSARLLHIARSHKDTGG